MGLERNQQTENVTNDLAGSKSLLEKWVLHELKYNKIIKYDETTEQF